jgi:hypothetical protein
METKEVRIDLLKAVREIIQEWIAHDYMSRAGLGENKFCISVGTISDLIAQKGITYSDEEISNVCICLIREGLIWPDCLSYTCADRELEFGYFVISEDGPRN